MREILFRGKRIDNGEWIYGDLRHDRCLMIARQGNETVKNWWAVSPETVGQFTGLCDKNGTKIFEGDILAFWDRVCGVVRYGDGTFDSGIYCYTGFYYETVCGDKDHTSLYENCDAEVIGNIHDNPELLE